eukprot:3098023-Rhodomonas_salina.2
MSEDGWERMGVRARVRARARAAAIVRQIAAADCREHESLSAANTDHDSMATRKCVDVEAERLMGVDESM